MPILRPFRALRYVPTHVPDLSAVLCPPYDIIGRDERIELLQRHPYNAVRLELPSEPEGVPDARGTGGAHDDARYRQAARDLVTWRSQGVLAKDALPSIYVHEMRYASAPAGGPTVARGLMARLRLEPLEPGSGVRPHERTMSGPKEDRYRLLRATGTNLSPVVLIHEQPATAAALDALTSGRADAEASEPAGIQHRLWVVPAGAGEAAGPVSASAATARDLLGIVEGGPLTIADGHHRYETALRYREERGQRRACESDPAYDYVLALVYAVDAAPAALATHRVVHGLGSAQGAGFLAAAEGLFHVDRLADAEQLGDRWAGSAAESGTERFGYAGPDGVALLTVRRERFAPLLDAALPEAAGWLDTSLLAVALRHLAAIGPEDLSGGGRVTYVKDAAAALAMTSDQQSTAFLLDPTPVASVLRVAEAGGVMPQKSTYFHPKAPTGLLFNPLE
ncbi:MAG: DUF1015 domain-containing protein, partial [Chloroflexi bacterium]|nr:DUF1015 domain-containing protein [Chloroflexota bacterium]